MKLLKPDFVPRMADRGLDDIILSVFFHQIGINELRMAINTMHPDLNIDNDEIVYYIEERGGLGLTMTGPGMKPATPRPDAPTGLTQSSKSISFTSPSCDLYYARWYVDGRFAADAVEDCTKATGRRIDKDSIGALPGHVVQVALVADGVVGWWARIEVE